MYSVIESRIKFRSLLSCNRCRVLPLNLRANRTSIPPLGCHWKRFPHSHISRSSEPSVNCLLYHCPLCGKALRLLSVGRFNYRGQNSFGGWHRKHTKLMDSANKETNFMSPRIFEASLLFSVKQTMTLPNCATEQSHLLIISSELAEASYRFDCFPEVQGSNLVHYFPQSVQI
jgi:hypothetical protein